MARSYARKVIRPEMTVRQIAADFPQSQQVFRGYGEHDAPPSRFGHLEPLTNFARRRGVALDTLLADLAAATKAPIERRGRFAEQVHRPFILAALGLTISFGAGWGAWLLWQIGMHGQFSSVPAAYVIAHGEAQLWGFIVLFVAGISLRTVLQGAAWHPLSSWFCRGLLAAALIGIAGSLAWSVVPGAVAPLGMASAAALCLMAFGLWIAQMVLLRAKWRFTWARAILISGFWLATWAVWTAWLRHAAGAVGPGGYGDSQRLLLIELAVFGFAMNSIYGFGQMLLPGLLRIGSTRDGAIELAHWLHNAGTIVVCLATFVAVGGLAMVVGSGLLVGGAISFAIGHRWFVGRKRTTQREEQGHWALDYYPPLAFFWLVAGLALMAGGVFYETTSGGTLPHAYMGAVRHALTVGFMTTLILGVGQRLIPVLERTVLAIPSFAIPILLLIGAGNALRVGTELAILAAPAAFRVMPASALLEWLALVLFSCTVIATMYRRDPLDKHGRVTRRSSLAVVLADRPWIEDRLRPLGTRYLERTRSVPEELTIGSFATSEGLDAAELVNTINRWLAERGPHCGDGAPECGLPLHDPQHRNIEHEPKTP